MPHKRILSQMFDVRPVSKTGDLDWEKIERVEKVLKIKHKTYIPPVKPVRIKKFKVSETKGTPPVIKKSWEVPEKKISRKKENYYHTLRPISFKNAFFKKPEAVVSSPGEFKKKEEESWRLVREKPQDQPVEFYEFREKPSFLEIFKKEKEKQPPVPEKPEETEEIKEPLAENIQDNLNYADVLPAGASSGFDNYCYPPESGEYLKVEDDFGRKFSFSDLFAPSRFLLPFSLKFKKNAWAFAGATLLIFLVIGGFSFFRQAAKIKNEVLGVSSEGLNSLESAVGNVKNNNFEKSGVDFQNAYQSFSEASSSLGSSSGLLAEIAKYVPLASQFSSGKYAIEAGKHMALAGDSLNKVVRTLNKVKNPPNSESENLSLLAIYGSIEEDLKISGAELKKVQENLNKINIDDLPNDKKEKFLEIKTKLPAVIGFSDGFLSNSEIFIDLLGGNGPRKYLFLFQNSQEMRPTGGFIGSYGILDIKNGRVRNFLIDGIFNPDGQLKENIVPPNPIMKISAAWSLHDSNWWPDFPKSAKKAVYFYEKTGGPTVDGVITLTPTVMQKLLEITGPIEMPEYDTVLTADNFVEKVQYEVETDYDKEENQPKKILADLAPLVLDKIFNSSDPQVVFRAVSAMSQGLNQKQILLYSENKDLEKIISALGWSGEILKTSKDYLQVVNTNINGFKTDGAIDEAIEHQAEIQDNGEIVDTVTITRRHNGGDSPYEWWNKVNADYLRVYVPLGSKLISAEGQTREFTDPPLDYDALGFKRDKDVEVEEKNMNINKDTGARTYEDSGKTVFANWTYVSPGETIVIKYKYLLPFKIKTDLAEGEGDSYSILFQKQSGSAGSKLISRIKYPDSYKIAWQYPDDLSADGEINYSASLETDKFIGAVFAQK